jgi:hypothetical protein
MSLDQLEFVIRPLARKLMDLTLGRYQVLENHRHRLPEFLTLCASDVENMLIAFSKLDVERATSDARAFQKTSAPSSQHQSHVAAESSKVSQRQAAREKRGDDGDEGEDDSSVTEARARQLEEEDEDARIASLTHEQYVAELRLQIQRLKTSENFLRSTLSDVLHELDHRTTAVEVKSGQIAQRDQRLARQREAFLRENRQLRDMVAQYREKGKCDLSEPVLYEWDADDVGVGGGGGGQSSRGRSRGESSGGGGDPFQQLRQQFKDEKETLEKGFVKQLEEANFKVRSLQAQATNAARSKLEQQQQITLLEAQMELLRSRQPLTENDVGATVVPPSEDGGSSSPHGSVGIASGPTSPRSNRAVQQTHTATQTDPNTPRSNPRTPPPPAHMLEVDPELHDVLVTRQPTPDGLGANIVRSVSTTALASNASGSQQPLTPRTSKQQSSSAKATAPAAAVGTKQGPHRVQVQPSKAAAKQQQHHNSRPAAAGLVLDPPGTTSGTHPRSVGETAVGGGDDGTIGALRQSPGGASGASPWNDGLVFGSSDGDGSGTQLHHQHHRVTSVLESTARTPSQLETFKMLEEQIALDQQQHPLFGTSGSPVTPRSATNGGHLGASPSDKKVLAELHRLRVENEQLRISAASTKVSGASAPQNNSLLLARLKVDLREKTALLHERNAEYDQLKSEAERWFDVYRQYVPPSDVAAETGHHHHRTTNVTAPSTPLVVNYEVVARLKSTVNAAELSEQRYRVLSWKVMDHHVRSSLAREGQLHDIRDAQKIFDMNLVASLQRQLEMMAFHQQRVYVRLRTRRAESRVESDILWDRVLTMARNVSKLQAVEDNPETPRYYLRNQQLGLGDGSGGSVRTTDVKDVTHAETSAGPEGPPSKSSVYFRVVSNAAAAYTLQHLGSGGGSTDAILNLSKIPIRGIAAASPQTLLPQRPQSASAALGGQHNGRTSSSNSMPQKLRASVTRPMSAAMARHGGRKPASSASDPSDDQVCSTEGGVGFQPSELRNLSGDDRRARILAAMGKDKSMEARNKLQLVEERRLLRASSSAARCPDMSRVEQPVFHMAKLIGRNEAPAM